MNLIKTVTFNKKALASLERVQVFQYRNSRSKEFWLPLQQQTELAEFQKWKRKHRSI